MPCSATSRPRSSARGAPPAGFRACRVPFVIRDGRSSAGEFARHATSCLLTVLQKVRSFSTQSPRVGRLRALCELGIRLRPTRKGEAAGYNPEDRLEPEERCPLGLLLLHGSMRARSMSTRPTWPFRRSPVCRTDPVVRRLGIVALLIVVLWLSWRDHRALQRCAHLGCAAYERGDARSACTRPRRPPAP